VPTFQGQGSKGMDSEAKSMAVMAAKTIEACAAEHGGSYESCLKDTLVAMEPSLNDAIDRLTVVTGSATHEVASCPARPDRVVHGFEGSGWDHHPHVLDQRGSWRLPGAPDGHVVRAAG